MINTSFSINKNFQEFLFALSFSLYSLLKVFTQDSGYSTIVLFIVVLACCVLSTLYNQKKQIRVNYIPILVLTCIVIFSLSIDGTFRHNDNTSAYAYNYIIYAIIPLFFLSSVKNYNAVLWFISVISVVNGVIYFVDPFIDYRMTGGYMSYGFSIMLPAFAGSCILFFYFKKKIVLVFITLFLIFSFLFSNKGATLTQLVLLGLSYVYVSKNPRINLKRLLLVLIAGCIALSFAELIIQYGYKLMEAFGLGYSYSLSTLFTMLFGDSDSVYGLRFDVWNDAVRLIEQKPIFGWGVGWYELFYEEPYPHNFLLQIWLEYGIIGTTVFMVFLLRSINVLFASTQSADKKVFSFMMLVMWIVPLSISLTYWKYMAFWIYIYLMIARDTKQILNRIRAETFL